MTEASEDVDDKHDSGRQQCEQKVGNEELETHNLGPHVGEEQSGEPQESCSNGRQADPTVDESGSAVGKERVRVRCWACQILIELPEDSVPEGCTALQIRFTCGGCGADNLPYSVDVPTCTGGVVRPARSRGSMFSAFARKWQGRLLVCVIPCAIVFYGIAGLSFIPVLYPTFPEEYKLHALGQLVFALVFEFQVLFHYAGVALTPPGSPPKNVEYGCREAVAERRLATFSLCRRCDAPRPPLAHHCSVCETCVYDLDHHCPFVHNCVGYANRRHFCLFLFFTVVGSAYPLLLFFGLAWLDSSALLRHAFPRCMPYAVQLWYRKLFGHPVWRNGGDLFLGSAFGVPMPFGPLHRCTDPLGLTFFVGLIGVGTAGMLGAGVMLLTQLRSLAEDSTTLECGRAVAARQVSEKGRLPHLRRALANVFRTLGPPSSWVWPSFGPFPEHRGGRPHPPVVSPLVVSVVGKPDEDGALQGESFDGTDEGKKQK